MMLLPSLLCVLFILTAVESQKAEGGRPKARQAPQSPPSTSDQRMGSSTTRQTTGDVDQQLSRFEVMLVEKVDNVRMDLRGFSRKLQELEWKYSEYEKTLETYQGDVSRIHEQISTPSTQTQPPPPREPPSSGTSSQLEPRVENLAKGVQILIAATRALTSDVFGLKKNVSLLLNDTRSFLVLTPQLVTKQFLNNGLLELKQRQVQLLSENTCPKSDTASSTLPRNCREVFAAGQRKSGIYRIHPDPSSKPFMVVCDQETRGGGWTVIHNRYDGSQDFYQNWQEYKHGFGNLGGEFWLGLDYIHQLTGSDVSELLVELQDLDMASKSAYYSAFSVGPETEGFPLKVLGGYSGDAGDSLLYHAGSRFSAKDMDQDGWPEGSCAQAHGGAWWYRSCDMSNLNGRYLSGQLPEQYIYQGMYWADFRGAQYSLNRARMLVRPREQINSSLVDEIFNRSNVMPAFVRGRV
uniref:Fibrinogen C-terminal domain-containing protein n=1 Tax=Photinus pyralis TaxID=7054 RepID=A0A1Y1L3J5_PHOPY